ncbi:MAG: type IV pilus assembly protein PilM [Deltaproteobacteria bacterium]|nr:type IV pilus assembly protein PilM [Deltaproteobacteria bacterium]
MLFRKSKTLLGLNIGSGYVKIVELKDSGSVYTLSNFGMAALPADAIVDGTIMDTTAIVKALQSLAVNLKLKKKRVSTSISAHSVIIKRISLPVVDENTLEETIHQEATQHIPYDITDVNLDFQILGPNQDNPGNLDIILVAVKKDTINDYLMVIEEAGFVPVVVDVDTFALENSFAHNYADDEPRLCALVDIGANLTSINVIDQQGMTRFSRNLNSGGRLITEQLQKRFSLNYEKAELLKQGSAGVNEVDPAKAAAAIREAAFPVTNEICKAVEFYHSSSSGGERLARIILSGGGAVTYGLRPAITKITGIETELFDPFRNIMIPEKSFDLEYIRESGPLAAVAVGLALRKDEGSRK